VTTPVGYQEAVVGLLEATPGARWFTTEGTCGSLRDRSDAGTLIHSVYLGPFPTAEAALAACPAGPPDAYAKRLDDGSTPGNGVVSCA
jgi:serine/threonine-protein kinase